MNNSLFIFKPRRVNKRTLILRKKLEQSMTIDHFYKTIIIPKDLIYIDCLMLEKFYQGYTVDVVGDINLFDDNLDQLPLINFNKITGFFSCSSNKLTSLQYAPKYVNRDFFCGNNSTRFTKEDVLKQSDVKGEIRVFW
jgi:hypothetical protein